MTFFIVSVQCADLELALITAVLPPAMLAANTPKDNKNGKLNGLMIRDTPYGILYTLVTVLGKQRIPLKCVSGFAHFLKF